MIMYSDDHATFSVDMKFKPSVKMGKKGDLSNFECGRELWCTEIMQQNLNPPTWKRENSEGCFVEALEERPDSFKMIGKQQ